MSNEYIEISGQPIPVDDLRFADTRELVQAIVQGPYTHLIQCQRTDLGEEVVIFDAEIELSQRRIHDIKRYERIAILCNESETVVPEILALRSDFPQVPHLNIRPKGYPCSLCIFDEPLEVTRLHWSAPLIVERIRLWLALTAKGKLHAGDQPLEPLLPFSLHQIVVPHDLFTAIPGSELLMVKQPIESGNGRKTFIASRIEKHHIEQVPYVVTPIAGKPQPHGIISAVPDNLFDLHDLLLNAQIDLIGVLRTRLKKWKSDIPEVVTAGLILVVWLPKQRDKEELPEIVEERAFLLDMPIQDIGAGIGVWEVVDPNIGIGNLFVPDDTKRGQDVPVRLLNIHASFSRNQATRMGGLVGFTDKKIVLVGVGALGSQVLMNLARMGYGQWTLIDNDLLLPHNLARHALGGMSVGYPKALAQAATANALLDDESIATGITADIMASADIPEIATALETAQVIIDASTSIPAARHLTHELDSSARRISIFLNPTATDLVVLAEGQKRTVPLDMLEMQYYRSLIHETALEQHLQRIAEPVRYAHSCRDLSATIPQDLIALQSALCSRVLRDVISKEECMISVWHSDDEMNVKRYSFPASLTFTHQIGQWTIRTDQWLIDKLSSARMDKLPNETGGVLLGSYDMQRKIIYIVDTILSPPDSQEWPTVYIRGYEGLRDELERVTEITDNRLEYIGEWHSHPAGVGCSPSQADLKAFQWLSERMGANGHPALTIIVGDNKQYAVYLEKMEM